MNIVPAKLVKNGNPYFTTWLRLDKHWLVKNKSEEASMSIESIKIIGAVCSVVGSGILAFRVTGILSALSIAANAHEINIQQLMPDHKGNIINLGNSTAHVERAQKKGLLIIGFVLIISSGVLQLIALVMSKG
jgi:hypothetical protein